VPFDSLNICKTLKSSINKYHTNVKELTRDSSKKLMDEKNQFYMLGMYLNSSKSSKFECLILTKGVKTSLKSFKETKHNLKHFKVKSFGCIDS